MTADSEFWRFSLRFYALPSVAPACLALQDGAGVDVNVLLFLLFMAEQGQALSVDDVKRLDAAIAAWRETVVKPLRTLRRHLKSGIGSVPLETSEGFRLSVKRMELEAERIEQHLLEQNARVSAGDGTAREAAAKASLAAYGAFLGALPEEQVAIVLGAFASALPK